MSKITDFLVETFLGIRGNPIPPKEISKSNIKVPPARSTESPDAGYAYSFENDKTLIEPGFQFDIIPLIRKLSLSNPSVSQALNNIVSLANTGHTIYFDSSVKADKIDEMRNHLSEVSKNWQYGVAGIHGLANKIIHQGMISGSMCVEALPNLDLNGIHRILIPYPETIRFLYNKKTVTYEPHQVSKDINKVGMGGYKPLNINTFKYVAINGDSEKPYGNPPYLPVIKPLEVQQEMTDNIRHIIKQIGIVGFLELLIDKPVQKDGETDDKYATRITQYLSQTKTNVDKALKDGLIVGYKEDHEFKFNSISKNAGGVAEFFSLNQKIVHSALKQDGSLSGEGSSGSESGITVIFTKLLSELKNIQICAAHILQFIYEFEFRLAGFEFKNLEVEFKASTIQDDLKLEQALEIKIRNLRQLRMDGIIDQDQYADELGYEDPAEDEPIVPFAPEKTTGDPNLDAQKKAVREKSKDKSDRRVRDKNKPQGIRQK